MLSLLAYDHWLPRPQLETVHALVEAAYAAKSERDGPRFSWYAPKQGRHLTRLPLAKREVAEAYIDNLVARLAGLLGADHVGYEWWSNHGNDLGWHVDKDETLYDTARVLRSPLWSTVFYTDVALPDGGGELALLADETQALPYDHALASHEVAQKVHAIAPCANRLVVFRRGLYHRIDPFVGRRSSLAVNLWDATPREFDTWSDTPFCHPLP